MQPQLTESEAANISKEIYSILMFMARSADSNFLIGGVHATPYFFKNDPNYLEKKIFISIRAPSGFRLMLRATLEPCKKY